MKGNICYIRTIEKNDIPLTQKWINDPDISEIMGYLPVMSLENQLDWFDNIKNDKSRFIFAICLNENHEHIGNVGLGNINYIHRRQVKITAPHFHTFL
jgi:RimJ/RimL family protein N-acetyltransferase